MVSQKVKIKIRRDYICARQEFYVKMRSNMVLSLRLNMAVKILPMPKVC